MVVGGSFCSGSWALGQSCCVLVPASSRPARACGRSPRMPVILKPAASRVGPTGTASWAPAVGGPPGRCCAWHQTPKRTNVAFSRPGISPKTRFSVRHFKLVWKAHQIQSRPSPILPWRSWHHRVGPTGRRYLAIEEITPARSQRPMFERPVAQWCRRRGGPAHSNSAGSLRKKVALSVSEILELGLPPLPAGRRGSLNIAHGPSGAVDVVGIALSVARNREGHP